jgi:N-methylhydantoinase A/oxoprolinase/acetone carboxylase beta subunit
VTGPAIITEPGGTTVLPPGWTATIEASGSLLCHRIPKDDDHD